MYSYYLVIPRTECKEEKPIYSYYLVIPRTECKEEKPIYSYYLVIPRTKCEEEKPYIPTILKYRALSVKRKNHIFLLSCNTAH